MRVGGLVACGVAWVMVEGGRNGWGVRPGSTYVMAYGIVLSIPGDDSRPPSF